MIANAGHTIAVSGATIALCWFGLTVFPVMLLSTVGGGAGLTIIVTFFANITLTPAMLLSFPNFFSTFGIFPCRCRDESGQKDSDEHARHGMCITKSVAENASLNTFTRKVRSRAVSAAYSDDARIMLNLADGQVRARAAGGR